MTFDAKIPDQPLGLSQEAIRTSILDQLAHHQIRDQHRIKALDLFQAVAASVRARLADRWHLTRQRQWSQGRKRVYYLSMEYLPGRLLRDALTNLGILEQTRAALASLGADLDDVMEAEEDPALGNGGLGRLASCFLDSMATLGIPAMGYGIRYDYGIFRQVFVDGEQVERPDDWLAHGTPWEVARPDHRYTVRYGGHVEIQKSGSRTHFLWCNTDDVFALGYDLPIPGYRNDVVNTLRLWRAVPVTTFDLEAFNDGRHDESVVRRGYAENISRVLYPSDHTRAGQELRLRQEYFFVSASLQDALRRHLNRHGQLDSLPTRAVFQLNDTHPALAIAEMMRLLVDDHHLDWAGAWSITQRCFAYTNHTLLPEALETWPEHLMDRLLPRQLDLIREIDLRLRRRVRERYPDDPERESRMGVVEHRPQGRVRMAHLSIVGSFSVNGVSALHSRLLAERVFPDFAEFYPGKFGNKTNGVTPRRWLLECNPGLAELLTDVVGHEGWVTDLDALRALEGHADDASLQEKWRSVKRRNKVALAQRVLREHGVMLNPDALFDVQIKRIHEYKRQLLNLLHVVHRYQAIKRGARPAVPRAVLFGGKAASGYRRAKEILRLANAIAATINADPEAQPYLQVHVIPNYRVTWAERLIPAADLSEQISCAGQEASGTGNMKFAMNGALTIGTLDGANIEIRDAVGEDHMFIFGLTAQEVETRLADGYEPRACYEADAELRSVLEAVADGAFEKAAPQRFKQVVDDLLAPGERYMHLLDYAPYLEAQRRVDTRYQDPSAWTRSAVLNTARMGHFSSDQTIRDYARDIWRVPTGSAQARP